MHPALKALPIVGRILLALIFVLAGIGKLSKVAVTSRAMASHGIPLADYLVWGAVALELGGGLMLVAGLFARLIALAFFAYLLALAVIFQPYWTLTGDAARVAHTLFYAHLSIMGGMLFVAAFGAGPYSIDAFILESRKLQATTAAQSPSNDTT
jgi:putative oxidoreductase